MMISRWLISVALISCMSPAESSATAKTSDNQASDILTSAIAELPKPGVYVTHPWSIIVVVPHALDARSLVPRERSRPREQYRIEKKSPDLYFRPR